MLPTAIQRLFGVLGILLASHRAGTFFERGSLLFEFELASQGSFGSLQ